VKRVGWIILAIAVAVSPVDTWLDARMPRLVLLAMPVWLTLGVLAAAGRRWRRFNPRGLAGVAWAIGAIAFWMIPRSVDAVRTSEFADQLMHGSMLTAGMALALSWRIAPFVVRGAIAIYGVAMMIALGAIYTSYSALLCGMFDLAQQKQTGEWLLRVSPAAILVIIIAGMRSLRMSVRHPPGAGMYHPTPAAVVREAGSH